jgi:threonine dehydratase
MHDGVKQTLLARVYDVAKRSPLDYAAKLSQQLGTQVHLKREDLQPVHSFKLRGAYNKIVSLSDGEKSRGIIAASAGNHAQGVALAAKKLGLSAVIVMPTTTPIIKVDAVRALGAEVELAGDSYSDAAEHCKSLVKTTGRVYVHPFDDPLVIAGQGTIGREIVEQLPDVTRIYVPVGGGGLLAGVAQYVKTVRPDIRIIGVEPDDSNVMQRSLKQGRRVTMEHVGIFADGVAVKRAGKHTFELARRYVDEVMTVSTDEMCAAIKHVFEATRTIVEPAGALGAAGIVRHAATGEIGPSDRVVAINSGANMTFERLQYIAERTLIGSNREAIYNVQLDEKPGALQRFCEDVVNGYNITQFGYRLRRRSAARIFVGIGFAEPSDRESFNQSLQSRGYTYDDLTNEDIAKEHVRHMIGGPAPRASNEHFYRIVFPERPGALNDFLRAVSGIFNISLFHYRGQGADTGSVLIGFEAKAVRELEQSLNSTGYTWARVDDRRSIRGFIASESG